MSERVFATILGTGLCCVYVVSLDYVILSKIVPCPFPSCYKSTMATSWFSDVFGACENLWNLSNQPA